MRLLYWISLVYGLLLPRRCRECVAFQAPTTTVPSTFRTTSSSSSSFFRSDHRRNGGKYNVEPFQSTTALKVSPLVAIGSSPIGSLVLLGGIVVVHECGHYFAARYYGMKVEEFSVGVGPRLFGFEAFGNEFNLRAIPLGGYVRFPQNYNVDEAQQRMKEAQKRQESRRKKNPRGGFLINVANTVTFGYFEDRILKKELKETEKLLEEATKEVANQPFWKNSVSLMKQKELRQKRDDLIQESKDNSEDVDIEYYDDPDLLQNRPWFQRAVVLSGGVIFNMILAFSIYFGSIGYGSGLPQPTFEPGVVVTQIVRPDSAATGRLRQGDLIVGVNGKPLVLSGPSDARAAQSEVSSVIQDIRQTPVGGSVSFNILRAEAAQAFPSSTIDISVTPYKRSPSEPQTIGVMLSPNFKGVNKVKGGSIGETTKLAMTYFMDTTSQTTAGFVSLFSNLFTGNGIPPGESISGPIGLIKTGSDVVRTQDLTTVLLFAAAISINLGVLNALPIPGLDGGQLMFVLAEAVSRRKIDQQVQEAITSIAILMFLLISVSTAFGDVSSILSK